MIDKSPSRRWTYLDKAKGLAIFLVVLGHAASASQFPGHDWYYALQRCIYGFHMPFFMFISGFVSARRVMEVAASGGYGAFVRQRAMRLLVPFAVFGLILLFAKIGASHLETIRRTPASLSSGLADLVFHTENSGATTIWYLYALFVFLCAAPIVIRGAQFDLRIAFAVAFVCYLVPAPGYFYLDRVTGYFVFFFAGIMAEQKSETWHRFVDRTGALLALPFLASFALIYFDMPQRLVLFVIGFLSIPVILRLMRALETGAASRLLLRFAQNTMAIYLLNTLSIGLTTLAALRLHAPVVAAFPLFIVVLTAAGIYLPMLAKRLVFARDRRLLALVS